MQKVLQIQEWLTGHGCPCYQHHRYLLHRRRQ
jgi:hypothetical protein